MLGECGCAGEGGRSGGFEISKSVLFYLGGEGGGGYFVRHWETSSM